MRKLFAFASTLVLALSMTVSAFAAGSPQVMGVVSGVESAVDKDGKDVKVEVKAAAGDALTVEEAEAVKELTKDAASATAIVEKVLGADAKDLVVVDVKTVTVPEGFDAFPIKVTFKVDGVTASSTVKVLGYVGEKQAAGAFRAIWSRASQLCSSTTTAKAAGWVEVPAEVKAGQVVATMDFAGPVAFVVDKATQSVMSKPADTVKPTEPGKVTPDTGDHNSVVWFGLVAVAACAVITVTAMKKRA